VSLIRVPDWNRRLQALFLDYVFRPFHWRYHNCGLFSGRVVEALTGVDPVPRELRSAGDNAGRTLAAVRRYVGDGPGAPVERLVERLAMDIGAREIRPANARRGDVVLLDVEELTPEGVHCVQGPAFGVVVDRDFLAFPGESGMVYRPRLDARRAWRIG
jgi:hypothetical protein